MACTLKSSQGVALGVMFAVNKLATPPASAACTHSPNHAPCCSANRPLDSAPSPAPELSYEGFTDADRSLFESFSVYSGRGVENSLARQKTSRAIAKRKVALEVLSYHTGVCNSEVNRIQNSKIASSLKYCLYDFKFNDYNLDDDDTVKACIRMFVDLDLLATFQIRYEVFCRWVLTVKKNYRAVKYHNWRHAFNVTQTMFCILMNGGVRQYISDTEMLALLVGCLCHDLDHRGTTNQFQIKTTSPLAQLYSTSTMEHHHYDQCLMILNSSGTNILSSLNRSQFSKLCVLLKHAIISTDLAIYFQSRTSFFQLVEKEKVDWTVAENTTLLRGMMMTACDIAAITKPWNIQKHVAQLIASEFFEQGDMEKQQLHIEPIDMLNRDKSHKLPSMQVDFIDSVCLPIYKAFSKVNEKMIPLTKGCESNRVKWLESSRENVCKDSRRSNHVTLSDR